MSTVSCPEVVGFFHKPTFTVSYLVIDSNSRHAAVIDPVLDYDSAAGRVGTASADAIVAEAEHRALRVDWVLDTHIHADHLSAASHVAERLAARRVIGDRVGKVQATFKSLYNIGSECPADGSQFDKLVADGDRLQLGALSIEAWSTPGHTPACMTYLIGDAAFVGDTLFMPDAGSARADFPGGDAAQLYHSLRRILALPGETRLFVCHDYGGPDRDFAWQTTVAAERAGNIHVHDGVSEQDYVRMRSERDAQLSAPALIWPAVQVNIRGGRLPAADANGIAYLRIPLNQL